ncbi:Stp1/IreP family PP2C-type Ser/Thr phosphatase [Pelomicrobium methylotrophicum]|uniref:Stp1/IreP family PP2C-type Ser/Thr phosphatase n=2 Tax=Pelomicrobium methylotrophicum TaxID=2602750 RepID=A0A5C7ESW9_9PROT|nr:Stp1/IreP family PP2C-type Ser/Thr phosphatase [Pelomicrobium methylotrophicum]
MVSVTDAGMVRTHNEDSVGTLPEQGIAILADGMGGYNAGEVASGIAVSLISAELSQALAQRDPAAIDPESGRPLAEIMLRDEIRRANASVYQAAQSQPQYAGMGTTLVVTLFFDNRVAIGHIGDSRTYRLRGEQLTQITKDHSLLQEQIDSGMISREEARRSCHKNLVTRALGIDPEVEPEIHVHDVQSEDIYLLCSDGLNDMVEDEEIRLTLLALRSNLPLAAHQLVQMANDNGGRDNVSVILIRVKHEFPVRRRGLLRLLSKLKK